MMVGTGGWTLDPHPELLAQAQAAGACVSCTLLSFLCTHWPSCRPGPRPAPSFRARPVLTAGTAEGDAGLGTLPATAQGHGQSGSEWDRGESRCWPRVPPD